MPTQTVYPTAVDFGVSTVLTLVGGAAGLSDGSDATYLGVSNLDGVNGRNVKITFDAFAVPADAGTVQVEMLARFQHLSGIAPGKPSLSLPYVDPLFGNSTLLLNMTTFASPGGSVVDEAGPTAFIVADRLTSSPLTLGMEHAQSSGAGQDFRIYELAVRVTWADTEEPPPEPPTALAVVRQYPRDDGLGLSSAPRLYPASKARRRVGGYQ